MPRFNSPYISACGLDCEACEIRRFPFDETAAETAIAWFRSQGWLKENEGVAEAIERSMTCTGCRGDRTIHWSPDCWILACCVDKKGLKHCSQCETFPCERLVEWSRQDDDYARALEQLRTMRADWGTADRRKGSAA